MAAESVCNEPFSYTNETLEEDRKLTALEVESAVRHLNDTTNQPDTFASVKKRWRDYGEPCSASGSLGAPGILLCAAELESGLEQRVRDLRDEWRKRALAVVPPEYADRSMHEKYLRLDNYAAGIDEAADELTALLGEK